MLLELLETLLVLTLEADELEPFDELLLLELDELFEDGALLIAIEEDELLLNDIEEMLLELDALDIELRLALLNSEVDKLERLDDPLPFAALL